jgi:pimeloyl-ACP methyl ester carboxylesterase
VEIRELVVDRVATRYRVVGEGAPVVLVHGLSGSWRWWQPVLEPLAERRRVHVLDLPRLGPRLPATELTGIAGADLTVRPILHDNLHLAQ